jgi:hypothetical protein
MPETGQEVDLPPVQDSPPGPTVTDESDEGLERAGLLTRPADGTVSVRGYFRRDGTYVQPYTRAVPARGMGKATSGSNRGRR